MDTQLGVVALVLVAALMHATWNAVVKSGGDKLAMQTLVACGGALAMLPVALAVPFPDRATWPYLALSSVLHAGYGLFLVAAYQAGDLSQVYPIARGAAPALVAGGAWLAAGETLPPLGIAGVLVVSAGIMSLTLLSPPARSGSARPVLMALVVAAFVGTYSVVDGMGARRTPKVMSYVAWIAMIDAVPLGLVLLVRRRGRLAAALSPGWRAGLAGGAMSAVAYGIVLWAMRQIPIAHVVALRETSVIAAAAIGARWLGEPFGRPRLIAASVVAAGAALMRIAG